MTIYNDPEAAPTALHTLLLKAVPLDKNGNRTLANLAKVMGLQRYSVTLWVRKQRIPPKRAKQVAELSEGRVTVEEFNPFVYRD